MSQKILIVDDEPMNLDLLEAYLAPLGHVIERAAGGHAALRLFDTAPPDLVLLDVMMPDLDGIDVLTHIRARVDASHVPVVLVTAYAERAQRVRGLEAGADELLEKPIDRAILLARVKMLLRLKEATDELEARNTALQRLQHDRQELIDFLVHDLKNPLGSMLLNLEWIRGQDDLRDRDVTDALRDTEDAARRTSRLVEDILTMSRIEDSRFPLRLARIELAPLLDEVVRGHARTIAAKEITMTVRASPAVALRADVDLFRRVIENVLGNSLRFTPERGGIELAVDVVGARVELRISNTGAPVAPADRERIFEKFSRGRAAATSLGNVGLGLYFCRRAVEAHAGTLRLEDVPGWPTSFVVSMAVDA